MGSVRKAPRSSRWEARWRSTAGRSRTKSFDTKSDARAYLATVETDLGRGTYVDPSGGRVRFDEWATRWWATTNNLRPSTRARDESYYRNHIEPAFARAPLATIDHLAVREWLAGLSAQGLAPATVHKAYQVLSKIMGAAVDAGLLAVSPCERQPLPRVERQEMRFLDPGEAARLADVIDARYRRLVLLGAYGGLRAGELFALRRERVDVLHARVEVTETVVEVQGRHHFGPPKTRAGRRAVPLPRFVAEELGAHLEGVAEGGLVFPAPQSGPVRASLFRRRFWTPAVEAAGLAPLRLHDLRHTAVAFWIAAGASSTEIAARAGHTSVVTVLDRYGHLLPGAAERVDDALDVMARDANRDRNATARGAGVVRG